VSDIRKALRQLEEMNRKSAARHEHFNLVFAERAAETNRKLEDLKRLSESGERRLCVNKRTHRVRFEAETEDSVEIIIEPYEGAVSNERHTGQNH